MDTFRWLAVVLSTILGLGTTRILGGFVSAFKMRRRVRPDWLPLSMGGVVLIEIVQFWWALAELLTRPHWSMTDFALLLALAMRLFLSAALISPSEADLADGPGFFVRDGRYALLVLGLFHVMALVANRWIWGQPVLSSPNAPTIALVAICFAAALTTNRRTQATMAVLYLLAGFAAVTKKVSHGSKVSSLDGFPASARGWPQAGLPGGCAFPRLSGRASRASPQTARRPSGSSR
jgi:hypothetical protein